MGREASKRASYDSARVLLEARLDTLPDDARFHSQLGIAYAGLRRFDEAMREGARAMELLPTSRDAFDAPFLIVNFAEACVMAGRYEDAIAKLEFLLSIPGFVTPAYLELDPIWGPLHSRPKFQQLCKSPTL